MGCDLAICTSSTPTPHPPTPHPLTPATLNVVGLYFVQVIILNAIHIAKLCRAPHVCWQQSNMIKQLLDLDLL